MEGATRAQRLRGVSVVDEPDFEVSLELELGGVVVLLVSALELGVVVLEELGVVELELLELGVVDWLEDGLEVELGVVDMSVLCDLLRVDLLQPPRHSAAAMSVVAPAIFNFCRLMNFSSQGFIV